LIELPLFERRGGPASLSPLDAASSRTLGDALAAIEPWVLYPIPADDLAAAFAAREPGAQRYAIRSRNELAGALIIRPNWLRGPYLQFLGLMPAYQGKGLGTRILDWFEAEAKRDGARNLWVATSEFNSKAEAFYARSGFTRSAVLDNVLQDGISEVLMRKRLIVNA